MDRDRHSFEDIAIRVMYFLNTMDTYLIASVVAYLLIWHWSGFPVSQCFPPAPPPVLAAGAAIVLYCALRLADFHPLFVPFSLLGIFALVMEGGISLVVLGQIFLGFFVLTSVVQIIFMGMPMGLAARSAAVPFRMYLNSFAIIAPTTISLPLTLCYQVFLTAAASSTATSPRFFSFVLLVCSFIAGGLVRRYRKKGMVPPIFHPPLPPALYKRVVILNIDGLSELAFEKGHSPFLKSLQRDYASVEGGAHTVYRALTNPAFASILSGVEPERHGVVNNNFNQVIRTEALPDIIPTRLYGNMHVRHFSRPGWNVTVASLVEVGYRRADEVLINNLKNDLLAHRDDIRLWVADLSEVDYCGHAWGSYSRQHSRALTHLDALVKDYFSWLHAQGLWENTLVIISSDHGMRIGEHSFILHPEEERVPIIFAGAGVAQVVLKEKISIIDIAANVSYALATPYCRGSRGRVFPGLFQLRPGDGAGKERSGYSS